MTATPTDRPRRDVPRTPLALLWTVAAVVVGFVGALLYALSEQGDDRALGLVLVAAALLAAATAVAVVVRPDRVRTWSLTLSASFIVLGLGAALVPLTDAVVFVEDVLLLGGPPVVAGIATAGVALAGRRRS